MKAIMSTNKTFVMVYNKEGNIIFAGRLGAVAKEYSSKLVDILLEKGEYESPYYKDKQQLQLKFNN